MPSDTIGFRNMETKSVTARIRTGSYRTKIPFESTDFKENGKENLLLISYPSTVPAGDQIINIRKPECKYL